MRAITSFHALLRTTRFTAEHVWFAGRRPAQPQHRALTHTRQSHQRHGSAANYRWASIERGPSRETVPEDPADRKEQQIVRLVGLIDVGRTRTGRQRAHLHLVGELVDVAEDGDAGVGEAEPAGHLDDEGAAGVLLEVVAVDGEGREAEDRVAGAVGGKVDEHAERVAGAAVVHV